jgi:hypothetical protein
VLDELLTVSTWTLIEIEGSNKVNDFDLSMRIGGRFKLIENFSLSLLYIPKREDKRSLIKESFLEASVSQSLELEFNQQDTNIFYLSTPNGLYKFNRREEPLELTQLDTKGLGSPSAISMSDQGYLLVGFTCGSIGLYHQNYTAPLTVWYHTCRYPIIQIKWCYLYFQDDHQAAPALSPERKKPENSDSNVKFATRMCEFFAIDQSEDFMIWNLQKSMGKPAHTIHFREKHNGQTDSSKIYRISMTCADQSFFTAFSLLDHSVMMYLMNFKKGSSITKEKLNLENKKSLKIITTLPINNAPDSLAASGNVL